MRLAPAGMLCALVLSGCGVIKTAHTSVEVVDGCYIKITGTSTSRNEREEDWTFDRDCKVTVNGDEVKPEG